MDIDKHFLEQEKLDDETINQVIKGFQNAGEQYNGLQCAIAMEILLRTLYPEEEQRTLVKEFVDNFYNVEVNK